MVQQRNIRTAIVFIVFYYICNCRICHGFDSMITDCYPVGIFSKIIDNRLCTIESFFTVSDPVLFITLIKKFFKTKAAGKRKQFQEKNSSVDL